jgi:hypothetical protein
MLMTTIFNAIVHMHLQHLEHPLLLLLLLLVLQAGGGGSNKRLLKHHEHHPTFIQ